MGNNCSENDEYGIYLDSLCNNNTIKENDCSEGKNNGIYLHSSSNNSVIRNVALRHIS